MFSTECAQLVVVANCKKLDDSMKHWHSTCMTSQASQPLNSSCISRIDDRSLPSNTDLEEIHFFYNLCSENLGRDTWPGQRHPERKDGADLFCLCCLFPGLDRTAHRVHYKSNFIVKLSP